MLRGCKVADGVRMLIVPAQCGSAQAEAEGAREIFTDAMAAGGMLDVWA